MRTRRDDWQTGDGSTTWSPDTGLSAPEVWDTSGWDTPAPAPHGEPALARVDAPESDADSGEPALATADEPPVVSAQGGLDGSDIEANIGSYLDFLSRLCRELGIPDPVEEYFAPVVGRWSDLHGEAERWRAVGAKAEHVMGELTTPLGGLDAAWQGADADSFIDYMNRVGLAGNDMSDAMTGMGEVLDATADGLREIVTEMAGLLAEVAQNGKQAMSGAGRNEDRTRQYLDAMNRPTRELFEAVRQMLEALVRLCDGIDGAKVFDTITMAHTFPEQDFAFAVPTVPGVTVPPPSSESVPAAAAAGIPADASAFDGGGAGGGGFGGGGGGGTSGGGGASTGQPPQAGGYVSAGEAAPSKPGGLAPAAAAAADAGGRPAGGGMMGGGMPMGMMGGMGGQGGGNGEHKPRTRVAGNPQDIFGKPAKSSPPVIGDN
ncbi:WXG100 family type VII secretion target [Actinokineospora enzanensis]|uniref:WXG100 family type VII secretion target n=1 Tax=Actinokineospora enzanensis TaxID=155975 RepID=UPI00039D1DE6|nr:WXG100 family type VII secretion target [Actinokineospora enzanensis]